MNPLPKTFQGRGDQRAYTFHLILRDGPWAILKKTKGEWEGYELVKIQKNKAWRNPQGVEVEARESLPGTNLWGVCGWSYKSRERAMEALTRMGRGSERYGGSRRREEVGAVLVG